MFFLLLFSSSVFFPFFSFFLLPLLRNHGFTAHKRHPTKTPPLTPTKKQSQTTRGNNNVLDGDNVFIAAQGARLRKLEARGKGFASLYFMPTSADAAVARARGWFARHGGFGGEARCGGIPWADDGSGDAQPPPPTRFEALERWESHTKRCPECMRAFRFFSMLRNAAAGLCFAALAWGIGSAAAIFNNGGGGTAAFTSASGLRAVVAAPPVARGLAVAAACAAAFVLLHQTVQKFVFVDYVHQDHD